MEGLVHLQSNEIIVERQFAHPYHTFYDRRVLCYMLYRLWNVMESAEGLTTNTLSLHLQQLELDGRWHRMIINNPKVLKTAAQFLVVGFFGQRRYEADDKEVNQLDQLLLHESADHPGLYGYSTMELTNGDTANCVVFRDETAKMHWRTSETHSRAVGAISPTYYHSIRLYNGRLNNHLSASENLELTCVKYYDFQHNKVWRAIRPFEQQEPPEPQE